MPTHIQINDVSPRVQILCDGRSEYEYQFPIFKSADLEVYLDGVKQTSGFAVSGAGETNGGQVTFDTPPAENAVLTLTRRLAIERLSDFQESGELRAKVLNDELDYMTAALQQVEDDQGRALQLSLTETANVDVTLPSPMANTTLMWNGTADAMTHGPTADQVMMAAQNAASAASSAQSAGQSASAAQTSADSAATSAGIAVNAAASNMYASNESKAADFAVLPADDGKQFLIDTSAGAVTVTLPLGADVTDGFRVALAKTSADNNAVIVNRSGTDTINGGASWQFSVPHGQSVIAMDTTPTPDVWFAAGVGVVAPIGVGDLQENARPYDIAFVAGFDPSMLPDDLAVQAYAELVMPRAGSFVGEAGYIEASSAGSAAVLDVEKNGVSIYTTPPQFAAASNALTPGVLKTDGSQSFVSGDRITFKVTATGSSGAGAGARFTMKGVLS